MLEGLSERISKSLSRRSFLGSAISAAGAIALALVGVKPAFATYAINGCNLCYNPATCSYSGCSCQWSWLGHAVNNGDGTYDHYLCYECYTVNPCPPNPNDACQGVKCSKSVYSTTTGGGGGGVCNRKPC